MCEVYCTTVTVFNLAYNKYIQIVAVGEDLATCVEILLITDILRFGGVKVLILFAEFYARTRIVCVQTSQVIQSSTASLNHALD